jgi:hypothetical protein
LKILLSYLTPTLVALVLGSIRDVRYLNKLLSLQYHLEGFCTWFRMFETMFTLQQSLCFSHGQQLPSAPLWSPAITLDVACFILALSS